MEFIDTHSHLYHNEFNDDRTLVVKNAIKAGVSKILLPNISSKYTKGMLSLCSEFPNNCWPMIGLHPCEVKEENYEKEMSHVKNELLSNKYIAVGEIGIDLYWQKSTLNIQKKAFIQQIKWAKEYNLPIVIHVRESFNEAINIVEDLNDKNLKGVFHCFTGSLTDAQRIINLNGFYLGIGGVLTFKNSKVDKVIEKIDIKHLILETDSPYLTPSPFRGKRNESKYLIYIAKKLAEIYHIEYSEVAKITTENTNKLFDLSRNKT